MIDKSSAVVADFQLIEDRPRLPLKRMLVCLSYVGLCAFGAYYGRTPYMSALMACLAGLAWPLTGLLAAVAEKVSAEQAALLRKRMATTAAPHRRQRRLSHQSR